MKKEDFTDEELTQALKQYENTRLDAMEGVEEHTFSPDFEQRMSALLHQRERRTLPILRWIATAAVLVLLLTPLFPQARAAALWIWEKLEDGWQQVTFFTPVSDETLPDVELTYIPEGLEKTQDEKLEHLGHTLVYESTSDLLIGFTFSYNFMNEESTLFTDYKSDAYTCTVIEINGNYGELYESKTEEGEGGLIWFDVEDNIHFDMTFILDSDVVLHIAEGAVLCK